jgi:hypothetical protein
VSPGAQEAVVRLRPAGRVQVLVLSPDGTPLKDARARAVTANGHRVGGPLLAWGTTAENGMVELETIAATVQIEANAQGLKGAATTSVPEGGTASVEIKLEPAQPPKVH